MAQFWTQYSDVILAILSFIGTSLTAIVSFFMKRSAAQRRVMMRTISSIAESLESFKDISKREHNKSAILMEEMKGRLNLNADRVESLRDGMAGLTGRIGLQQETIQTLTKELATTSSEIKAIFRYMDAPKRASDIRG